MNQNDHPAAVPPRIYESDFLAMKRCKHGCFLYNVHDLFVGRSMDLYGQWCEAELEILAQAIRPGHVVLDVGANIGTHTVFFAKQVQEQGRVIAFEPQRIAFQNLCANIALNGLVNVIAHQQGVGSQARTVQLPVFDPRRDMNFGALRMLGHTVGEPVEVVRIDDLQLRACNLIKIDVEGMECEVLEGARELIGRHRPVLFVENNTVERSAALISAIESLEYDGYWHISGYFDPRNFFRNEVNVFAQYQPEANLLCFHRSASVDIRGLPKLSGVEDNWQLALKRLQNSA